MAAGYGIFKNEGSKNIEGTENRFRDEIDELPEIDDDGDEIDELPEIDDDGDEIDELPEIDDDDGQEEIETSKTKKEGAEDRVESAKNAVENDMTDDAEDELRELTEGEKDKLRGIGMSEALIGKCMVDKEGVYQLKTTNACLEGKEHDETGVKFVRKIITINDVQIEGVFPDFPAVFTCYLPENLLIAPDKYQSTECIRQLQEALKDNPELAKMFTLRQLKNIMEGNAIGGYLWHHNEEAGKMELVKSEIHQKTHHDGGKSIWGGGKSER